MNKKRKSQLATIAIILIIAVIAFIAIYEKPNNGNGSLEEIAKCIGENSILYIQLGCHACETQEKMFEDNYQYLNVIDCFYDPDKCGEIAYTPTWIIKGEEYAKVLSIKELKQLTGC